jgi:hypothetical protein
MRLSASWGILLILAGLSAAAQETNFSVGPQYLITSGSPQFAQPIATPSMSLEAPLPGLPSLPQIGPSVENEPFVANPELRRQADLFPVYYGYQPMSIVEISSAEPVGKLPASLTDSGVTGMTDAQSLRARGYGVPLGDTASFWKYHKFHAHRVFTNADVVPLHPN